MKYSRRLCAACNGVALPPKSRDEAIKQAKRALELGLGRRNVKGNKTEKSVLKRISSGTKRLKIDFPMQTESDKAIARLAAEILEEVPQKGLMLYFQSKEMCSEAAELGFLTYSYDEPPPSKTKATTLVLVGTEAEEAEQVLLSKNWNNVILINPNEDANFDGRRGDTKLLKNFETVYSVLPLLVKGWFGANTEGVVFKCMQDGVESKWDIFIKEGNSFLRIASQASRPDNDELELALYNHIASSNPLIKGMKSVKGMFSGN